MNAERKMEALLARVAEDLAKGWDFPGSGVSEKSASLACQDVVKDVLKNLVAIVVPGCHGDKPVSPEYRLAHVSGALSQAIEILATQILAAFQYSCENGDCVPDVACESCIHGAERVVQDFLTALPGIQDLIKTDIAAAYEGDPAARSTMEVVQSYPGLYAIIVHRIAHFLRSKDVPLIPRIMAESAHSQTGIDIHPGAAIGAGFFIDHGTGVVIGETCVIGNHVKIYQGVTLGALSFQKDETGRLVKGIKRHPNVEDHVVIYAGATILGGDTTIGEASVIGGNVWLTHSVPPHSTVYNQQPKPKIRTSTAS